jgi:hypothetical protein
MKNPDDRIATTPAYPPNPPALLSSESLDAFDSVREAVQLWLLPRDFIETIWATDILEGEWETLRLRRSKVLLVKIATRNALKSLLNQLGVDYEDQRELADRWFTNKRVRRSVLAFLRKHDLDESAIDAEALQNSMPGLEDIDRRLAELEARRDRIVRRFEDYRSGLSTRVRASSDQSVDDNAVLTIENGLDEPGN